MNKMIFIFLIFISHSLLVIGQTPDLLIYKSDTIYIHNFPLEMLIEKDSLIAKTLNDTTCIAEDCYRQYIGIWKIQNDSLFQIGLKDCCEYDPIPLNKIFENKKYIKNQKVFASWFSGVIRSGFGDNLRFSEDNWENVYEKTIELKVIKGRIDEIVITDTNK